MEVGEDCRTLQALRESIVVALPQLCVEGFDVSVGGRALDDDEGVVSLQQDVCLDVSANSRGLSVLALREAGREVSEAGLLDAAKEDASLVTLFLDAGVPIDCVDEDGETPLHLSCDSGHLEIASFLLDRGSTAIDEKGGPSGRTPLHLVCRRGHLEIATLLLDRGRTAIDEKDDGGETPLHISCREGLLEIATLLLDRGSAAIDLKDENGDTPLHGACWDGYWEIATLLLDRGTTAIDEKNAEAETPLHLSCCKGHLETAALLLTRGCSVDEGFKAMWSHSHEVLDLVSKHGHDVLPDAPPTCAKRRRIGKQ